MDDTLTRLRRKIGALALSKRPDEGTQGPIILGAERVDRALAGVLKRDALHEFFAASITDAAAMTGFTAGLARCAAGAQGRKIVWVRQPVSESETGHLYAPGLAEWGLDPGAVIFIRARRGQDVLRAGLEAVRCAPLGAVLFEIWGMPRDLDLTASRRLALAAKRSGVPAFLMRVAADAQPTSAMTRWRIQAAPSSPLAANAPGRPAFTVTLLRNRAGSSGRSWCLEWNHDQGCFRDATPLSVGVVPVPAERPVEASDGRLVRAG